MNTGMLETIQPVVVACDVSKPVDCSHWWKVMPKKPNKAKYNQSHLSGSLNSLPFTTANPRITTPMEKRSHTIVAGVV